MLLRPVRSAMRARFALRINLILVSKSEIGIILELADFSALHMLPYLSHHVFCCKTEKLSGWALSFAR